MSKPTTQEPIDSLDDLLAHLFDEVVDIQSEIDFGKKTVEWRWEKRKELVAESSKAIKDLFSTLQNNCNALPDDQPNDIHIGYFNSGYKLGKKDGIESSKREAEIRIDEVKLYTNSINETGGGFDPIQYYKNRLQDLGKTDSILGSKIVIDTHMEKMGKVASMIEKLPGAQDSYKDRLTQLLDRFRLQWKIEGDEYHQSELEDDIIRLFTDSIGVFEVPKGDGSQQDKLTNERNSIRDSIMEKWGLYDD